MKFYLLHPVAVHFPIALLTLGFAAEGVNHLYKNECIRSWVSQAALWMLWLGTLAAWAAVGLGLLAEETVPHVPAAWEVLEEHEELAFWSAGLFTALSLCRFFLKDLWETRRWIFLAVWAVLLGLLFTAAKHGGDLVYEFGVGVARS